MKCNESRRQKKKILQKNQKIKLFHTDKKHSNQFYGPVHFIPKKFQIFKTIFPFLGKVKYRKILKPSFNLKFFDIFNKEINKSGTFKHRAKDISSVVNE